jgi:protoporphyrinogen/coproporphyrinogen III oxidase
MTHPVVVVGGGITGLVAARCLHEARVDVTLVEASDRLGGKILTTDFAGTRVEMGPDSFLGNDPMLLELCADLRLADELIAPSGFGAQVWLDEGLRPLPMSTYFGIPLDIGAARRSQILSPAGALRARVGASLPGTRHATDVSVGHVVKRRFGRQVLERMVDPVLAGTRAGDPYEVSTQAALPEAWSALEKGRRLTKALRGGRRSGGARGAPPFYGLQGGMQRLVDALTGALPRFTTRTHVAAHAIRQEGDDYVVETSVGDVEASGVVVTTPARMAAVVLAPLSEEAAGSIRRLEAADVAIATFSYEGLLRLPKGSGLLLPSARRRTLTGATWYSSKWPHAAPADTTIVRCFAGRAAGDALPDDHDELMDVLHADLSEALGGLPEPTGRQGIRWSGGLPIYRVGHLGTVEAIERSLAIHPRIRVAGAWLRGSGLPDCVRQATAAAEAVAAEVVTHAR